MAEDIQTNNLSMPATQQRGSCLIDGIFISNTISMIKGGFLPFGEFPSDHRAIWMDITFENAFGYKMPNIITPKARRLKSDDPKVRNNWIKLYKNFIAQHNLHTQLFKLEEEVRLPSSDETIDRSIYCSIPCCTIGQVMPYLC